MGAQFLKNMREELSKPDVNMLAVVVPQNWRAITGVVSKITSPETRLKIGKFFSSKFHR